MRKLQLWSALKEIHRIVDDWDLETFEKEMKKDEMTFRKFVAHDENWGRMQRYDIKIKIEKVDIDEEE